MNLLSVDSIQKSHGEKLLFKDISFGIDAGDRIGLVGVNGSGKSTLLQMLVDPEAIDGGRISKRKQLRIGYLQQSPEINPEHSVRDHIFASDRPLIRLIHEYEATCDALARVECAGTAGDSGSEVESPARLQQRLDRLSTRMQDENAFQYEAEIQSILRELGIVDLDRRMGELSGGMLKKVALAQCLIDDTELLLLDEPTNHLDIASILWLQKYLTHTKKAIFMITHDRYFLEHITDRIFELDPPELHQYQGNYATYLEKRAEREEQARRSEAKARNFLRKEVEWLRRMPKARGTKQKARIDRIREVQNRKQVQVDPAFAFSVSGRRLGKRILEVRALGKSVPVPGQSEDRLLFDRFTYYFKPGERIGIVGPNGVGKSTFLNVITGKLAPDRGEVEAGSNTRFGYFDQHSENLPGDRRVLEFIRTEAGETLTLGEKKNETTMPAAKVLEYFRFDGRLQHAFISKLSGGERRRLYLVFVLMQNPNFLILDEPTNDLDVQTLSLLEDFLQEFQGCLLVVSHDRYFMDRLVDQLFIFGSTAETSAKSNEVVPENIEIFPGSYADFLEYREAKQSNEADAVAIGATKPADSAGRSTAVEPVTAAVSTPKKKKKFSFKEKREFAQIEEDIAALEQEQSDLEARLADGGGDYQKLQTAGERLNVVLGTIETKYARWNELAESVESLE